MRPIIIDGSRYQKEQPTGVEVYANELIPRLLQRSMEEKVDVVVVSPERKELPEHTCVASRIISQKRLWTLIGLTWAFLTGKIKGKSLFVPSHILPLFLPLKSYITIHDVAYKYFPESYSLFQRALLEFSTWFAVTFSTGIVSVSQQTANDLKRFYNCPEKKLHRIYSGFDAEKFRGSFTYEGEKARSTWNLEKQKYFIFVGRVEEKKNTSLLVKSFLAANLPEDIKLVLVGKPGVGYEETLEAIRIDTGKRVILAGYQSNDIAYSLVQDALGFVFPSKFEGFGFPILEAYSLGVPVMCSTAGALPEIAGDAALYANTREELIKGFEYMHSDGFPRAESIEKGKKELERFSWEKCADAVWALIKE